MFMISAHMIKLRSSQPDTGEVYLIDLPVRVNINLTLAAQLSACSGSPDPASAFNCSNMQAIRRVT